jgi:KRAB domain-containing zinc finger protein
VVSAGKDLGQGCATFEDMSISFSQEEWELLSAAQRCPYLHVMLENFALITSIGCGHQVGDKEALMHSVGKRCYT